MNAGRNSVTKKKKLAGLVVFAVIAGGAIWYLNYLDTEKSKEIAMRNHQQQRDRLALSFAKIEHNSARRIKENKQFHAKVGNILDRERGLSSGIQSRKSQSPANQTCRASDACRKLGLCSAGKTGCEAKYDADCRASLGCRVAGECSARDGTCMK